LPRILATVLLAVTSLDPLALQAAAPLDHSVTWVGNSFPGASNRWVQNFFIHTRVQPDGTVNTWSHWDEGGKKFGVYKDGDVIGNTNVNPNSLETRDTAGRLWKLEVTYTDPKHQEWEFTPKGITCDGKPVTFPDLFQPMAIATATDGTLLVADSGTGPRQQVLFYDVSTPSQPRLLKAFGERGGIASGKPGEITPTKFWGIRGLGTDAAGNLYVAMSEQGSVLRSFSPNGTLRWELHGEFFCDVATADPADDGRTVWGIQERYAMDWSQPPGRDSRWVGYTLNRHRYPNDPRGLMHVKQQGEHGLTSPQIVYLEGKRFLFVGGMFASNFINIFRFDDGVAVPSGLILQWGNNLYNTDLTWPPNKPAGTSIWRDANGDGDYQAAEFTPNTPRVKPGPFWVDREGNIWMAYGFFRYDFQGLDPQGNPIYSADKVTVLDKPRGVNTVARVCYLDDSNTLVVAEEGVEEKGNPSMRHIQRVHICRGYLAGNRDTVSFVPGAGREAGCMAAAGDYVFTGGWKTRGRVWVNRIRDGAEVGTFEPGPTVGGIENTGWIDLLTGINAFRRSSGEYLVFVEENYKAKSLIYRWKPQP
jgi:sugar lactone lactonase YvrE